MFPRYTIENRLEQSLEFQFLSNGAQLLKRPKKALICLQKVLIYGRERLAKYPIICMTTLIEDRKIDKNCFEENAEENSNQDEENVGENNN